MKRQFVEQNIRRGFDETYPYAWQLLPWPAGTYSNPTTRIEDKAGVDKTAVMLTGSSTIDSNGRFTTPDFIPGIVSTDGAKFKFYWSVKIDGKTWSGYGRIVYEE